MAAVQQSGGALHFAGVAMQADRDVVLRAVRKQGDALRHASEELKADPDVVLAAARSWQPGTIAFILLQRHLRLAGMKTRDTATTRTLLAGNPFAGGDTCSGTVLLVQLRELVY